MKLTAYRITKGSHKASRINFGIQTGSKLERKIELGSGCLYPHINKDSKDLNKLFGFSQGFNHHKNSVRFAWRNNPESSKIEIWAYQYNKGEVIKKHICNVDVMEHQEYSIELKDGLAVYRIAGYKVELPFKRPFFKFGFRLYPYFGGQNKAPNNMMFFFNKGLGLL